MTVLAASYSVFRENSDRITKIFRKKLTLR